jgi:hypothetical protein
MFDSLYDSRLKSVSLGCSGSSLVLETALSSVTPIIMNLTMTNPKMLYRMYGVMERCLPISPAIRYGNGDVKQTESAFFMADSYTSSRGRTATTINWSVKATLRVWHETKQLTNVILDG